MPKRPSRKSSMPSKGTPGFAAMVVVRDEVSRVAVDLCRGSSHLHNIILAKRSDFGWRLEAPTFLINSCWGLRSVDAASMKVSRAPAFDFLQFFIHTAQISVSNPYGSQSFICIGNYKFCSHIFGVVRSHKVDASIRRDNVSKSQI